MSGITGEGIFWTIVAICATVIAIAVLANGFDGCNMTSKVVCKDGTSYTKEAFAEDPDLSRDDAEEFCENHGGVKEFVQ